MFRYWCELYLEQDHSRDLSGIPARLDTRFWKIFGHSALPCQLSPVIPRSSNVLEVRRSIQHQTPASDITCKMDLCRHWKATLQRLVCLAAVDAR